MNIKDFSKLLPFTLYYVGGCVRDEILEIETNDIDIASANTPESIKEHCIENNIKFYDTGLQHGTITLELDEGMIEHTTFRKDVSCDGRNATVEFTDNLYVDASRRDFTFNALYKNVETGTVHDYFNGILDLKTFKTIEFVGSTLNRIHEDHLRMIRYFRFANRFNLSMNRIDLIIIKENRHLINKVSNERIRTEFDKMLKDGLDYDILKTIVEIFGDCDNTFFKICKNMLECSSRNNKWHSKNNVLEHAHHVYSKAREII